MMNENENNAVNQAAPNNVSLRLSGESRGPILPHFILAVSQEQVRRGGEDAFSYVYADHRRNIGYCAVFDGCGGMGAQKYQTAGNFTGARLASNIAAEVVDRFYFEPNGGFRFEDTDAERLEEKMKSVFAEVKKRIAGQRVTRFKSDLYKELPTTLSIIASKCNDDEDKSMEVEYIWAGDSRGYLLQLPVDFKNIQNGEGLCLVTEDDLETTENALQNLSSDARLSNVVNADTDFRLHEKRFTVSRSNPVMLITATDGCFGYLKTPMHFENLLLDTLSRSESKEKWAEHITERLSEFAGDDYTMVITVFGCSDFVSLRERFRELGNRNKATYVNKIDNDPENEGLVLSLWEKYRENFEFYQKIMKKRR